MDILQQKTFFFETQLEARGRVNLFRAPHTVPTCVAIEAYASASARRCWITSTLLFLGLSMRPFLAQICKCFNRVHFKANLFLHTHVFFMHHSFGLSQFLYLRQLNMMSHCILMEVFLIFFNNLCILQFEGYFQILQYKFFYKKVLCNLNDTPILHNSFFCKKMCNPRQCNKHL